MDVNYRKVKVMREDLGMTDRGLATAAGISPSVLSQVKRSGSAHPASVLAIAQALSCTVSDIAIRPGVDEGAS